MKIEFLEIKVKVPMKDGSDALVLFDRRPGMLGKPWGSPLVAFIIIIIIIIVYSYY